MRRTVLLAVLPALVPALAILAPTAAAAAPAGAAGASRGPAGPLAESTRTNLLDAMHGEALARARYLAYAAQARTEGHQQAGALLRRTAGVELNDHFALEAVYVGLSGTDQANLATAIAGESYEATTMYPQFEAEALADGDTVAAALFHEIAADEAAHRDLYSQALAALTGSGQTPAPPTVDPVTVPAGPAHSSGRTLANLQTALRGEAFASASYLAFARTTRQSGHPALARLFEAVSEVELSEHWAGEAGLAGVVADTGTNLATAAAGEDYEAETMYPSYAAQAAAAGDLAVARSLLEIAADEADHRDAFRSAAARLTR
jgi:rubrerythrin